MRIIDSHFHWRPRAYYERLSKRQAYPRAEPNERGGYTYWMREDGHARNDPGAEWFELDQQLEHMDRLGHRIEVVSSTGTFSPHFSELPAEEGRDEAVIWNEIMAGTMRQYPGRFRASSVVPLRDTDIALEVLDHAITELGLIGVDLPGCIGDDTEIDAERLEPFYDRVEALGVPLFLHPTDAVFNEGKGQYNGALYLSLGRVIDVSVSAYRLVLSGIMERHPDLKVFMSHTGGALPYQAGRMDKNSGKANLPEMPSTYIKRMFTDTVSPHALGIKFAIDFYGIDHVMYGTDYPCWDPATALELLGGIGISEAGREKLFYANAKRILGLGDPAEYAHPKAAVA